MSSYNIVEFKSLISRVQQAADPEIKLALSRITAEVKTKLADASPRSVDFFESVRDSLNQLRGNANAESRVLCLLDCAIYFYVAGGIFPAVLAARDAVELAKSARSDTLLRRSLHTLGTYLVEAGCASQGIECLVGAIELARKLSDSNGYCRATLNLGVALIYGAQYRDAIACFDHASARNETSSEAAFIHSTALSNKALCYLLLEEFDQGLRVAEQAFSLTSTPTSGPELLSRVIRESNYIQLLLEAGQVRKAAARITIAKQFAIQAGSAKALALVKIAEGLVEVRHGDASRALILLKEALIESKDIPTLYPDAIAALVKTHEILGHHEEALEYLQQLMNVVRQFRADCALWQIAMGSSASVTRADCDRDDLRDLKHREALLRARVVEDRLSWFQVEMLERLSVTADLREEASGEHGYRVGRLSALLAENIGWNSDACLALDLAARLHDIGKIGVPDRILLNSQQLKDAERHFMSAHTLIGSELLARSNIPQLRMADEIARCHHEWWNGQGYPANLVGKQIPIHARIVALADVFDALTHGRPYAEPWSIDRALAEISNRQGTQFDSDLTGRFLDLIKRLRIDHGNLDDFLAMAGQNSPFLQARKKIRLLLTEEQRNEQGAMNSGTQTCH